MLGKLPAAELEPWSHSCLQIAGLFASRQRCLLCSDSLAANSSDWQERNLIFIYIFAFAIWGWGQHGCSSAQDDV